MNIDKAIEILTLMQTDGPDDMTSDEIDAIRLGIEALKTWGEFRGSGSLMDKMLLPGETTE